MHYKWIADISSNWKPVKSVLKDAFIDQDPTFPNLHRPCVVDHGIQTYSVVRIQVSREKAIAALCARPNTETGKVLISRVAWDWDCSGLGRAVLGPVRTARLGRGRSPMTSLSAVVA